MTEQPSHLGWESWQMIAAMFPQLQGKACSIALCERHAVAGVKRRVRRSGGYQLYWQPYCHDHSVRRGVDVVEGRLRFVEGFSMPL
jgi:hypothetical protein